MNSTSSSANSPVLAFSAGQVWAGARLIIELGDILSSSERQIIGSGSEVVAQFAKKTGTEVVTRYQPALRVKDDPAASQELAS